MSVNVMLDLETLGVRPGCAVLSIGAAIFDLNGPSGTVFDNVINLSSCLEAGLVVDPATELWWSIQSFEAQKTLRTAQVDDGLSLGVVLTRFADWIQERGEDVCVWGNGADFDLPILSEAYRRCGFGGPPWRSFKGRCYRTLKELRPDVPKPERVGVHHNALDDAIFQAKHAAELLQAISSSRTTMFTVEKWEMPSPPSPGLPDPSVLPGLRSDRLVPRYDHETLGDAPVVIVPTPQFP